ncbi:MAG: fimbiral protein pilA [Polyangiaceae bacterium]
MQQPYPGPYNAPPNAPYGGPPGYGPPGYGAPPPKQTNVALIIVLVIVAIVVVFIGVGAALAIYGARRYTEAAKTSEAKNNLQSIMRAARNGYEREQFPDPLSVDPNPGTTHVLCKSAKPVPATVPSGRAYQPSSTPGEDFESGSATEGWKCLKFIITSPIRYQYEYRVGGPYKGPARGGPDPGPNGFEISAEGDLDGDGKTSLFTVVGKVNEATKTITSDNSVFVSDEFE